ncbi:hypothetical protein PMIT1303_00061 [Prochlorococcus sp. MIT 1303]|nr:hypothetical protein PMIT1303_00061 [Prochlorococcus sp. MIT 1303]
MGVVIELRFTGSIGIFDRESPRMSPGLVITFSAPFPENE